MCVKSVFVVLMQISRTAFDNFAIVVVGCLHFGVTKLGKRIEYGGTVLGKLG